MSNRARSNVTRPSRPFRAPEKDCKVCKKPAFCEHYGVFSCNSCKSFFKKALDKGPHYCLKLGVCMKNPDLMSKCKACWFQKCVELGMTSCSLRKLRGSNEKLFDLVKNLLLIDVRRTSKIAGFYTSDDPTLDELVVNPRCLKPCEKDPSQILSILDWCFLLNSLQVVFFLDFEFIQNLPTMDKIYMFKANNLNDCMLAGAMRSVQSDWETLRTPTGHAYNTFELINQVDNSKELLKVIEKRVVEKMVDIKVTHEEFVLLSMVFFLDPATPNISETTAKTLAEYQNYYASALLQYCEFYHQKDAPTRFVDLLSIKSIVHKNTSDLKYLYLTFQNAITDLKIKKILFSTCDLPGAPQTYLGSENG
ncbi:hypothetical protein B9Z55_026451 [Caenorhabditis nigoni]|uniref:Nuclear receptor domain-containing protein n=1 Tax=Caenorhabditis nigoni TaxID=1611254 RepID=A0A2G5T3C1_9PELO|nr:hypothetical protein B9Z55_026451 [Caenorhabditis nigoni]